MKNSSIPESRPCRTGPVFRGPSRIAARALTRRTSSRRCRRRRMRSSLPGHTRTLCTCRRHTRSISRTSAGPSRPMDFSDFPQCSIRLHTPNNCWVGQYKICSTWGSRSGTWHGTLARARCSGCSVPNPVSHRRIVSNWHGKLRAAVARPCRRGGPTSRP